MAALSLCIRPVDSRGIELSPSEPFLPIAEGEEWRTVLRKCLVFAFHDRATCLIEADDKHALVLDFRHLMARTLRHRDVLVGCVPSLSPELAEAIVEGMEFELGWLWLTSPSSLEESHLFALATAVRACKWRYEELDTPEEVLFRTADGWRAVWLNPQLSRDVLVQELGKIAQSVGWALDVQGSGLESTGT